MNHIIRITIFSVLFLTSAVEVFSQGFSVEGIVLESKKLSPIEYAYVSVKNTAISTITNEKGAFKINNITKGKITLAISYLGYTTQNIYLDVDSAITGLKVILSENSLAINEVFVTAKKKNEDATTTYSIDRTTLEHLQSISISDLISLLPGEQTNRAYKLTSGSQPITIRGNALEMGNPSFGTAIEIDGIRLSNNSRFTRYGVDTRSISNSNIQNVEVMIGVPSVEYGDMTNGIVKIHSMTGKTPYIFETSIRPHTHLLSLSKGYSLGSKKGVLNLSLERAKSISDISSPYTSYHRNSINIRYNNTIETKLNRKLNVDFTLFGNVGGDNSISDPDSFRDTYIKHSDNNIRAGINLNYIINSKWIKNINSGLSISYSNNLSESRNNHSAASTQPSIHTTEEGYFVAEIYEDNPNANIILQPVGYWYSNTYKDDRPLNYSFFTKANWSYKLGNYLYNNTLLGFDIKGSGNYGAGIYYDDMRTAPTWREFRYDKLPFTNNLSGYLENEIRYSIKRNILKLKGGLRYDMTSIKGSQYGNVGSFSPRFNVSYSINKNSTDFIKNITMRAGWGRSTKLPSFDILYPVARYKDKLAFRSGTMADGTTFQAFHTEPKILRYNSGLRWQYNQMLELGTEVTLKIAKVSLSFFYNQMKNQYDTKLTYYPYTYKFTDQSAIENSPISSENRLYSIDRETGIVSVSDKTGRNSSHPLKYKIMKDLNTDETSINGSSSYRTGLEWIVDFNQIKKINTSIRLDGKYYYYKGINEVLSENLAAGTTSSENPYPYIGKYIGGSSVYNGYSTSRLNTNLTLITHIPKIRMIFSLRVEGTFINSRQNLSEYSHGQRSYSLEDKNSYIPTKEGIYQGQKYIALYPLYYSNREDISTNLPFKEHFVEAYKNDKKLYDELSKLVVKTNTGYTFKRWGYSPYFSANFNITKEIGKHITLSFYANNFFNTMKNVTIKQTGLEDSLYNLGLVTDFNYGLSMKIKI